MLDDWDFNLVQSFSELEKLWETYSVVDPKEQSHELGERLRKKLSLPIVDMDAESSKFFKQYQSRRPNYDIMLREGFEKKFIKESIA